MNNIAKLRREKGLSQSEFGKIIGAAQNTISNWESGKREPDYEMLIKLADFFGVSAGYILGRDESNVSPAELDRKVVEINVYGTIPAGIPIEAIEEIIGTEQIPAEWLNGGQEYYALVVHGDSMYPVYLDGDVIIIRKATACNTGDDCVVYVNGYDATLKRVKLYDDGSVEICPLNTNYAPRKYSPEEAAELPITIGGVVVELRRRIK